MRTAFTTFSLLLISLAEVRTYADAGVAGLWNDMNEISTLGQQMPNTKDFGKVYFPAGQWYDLATDALEQGGREQVMELSVRCVLPLVRPDLSGPPLRIRLK